MIIRLCFRILPTFRFFMKRLRSPFEPGVYEPCEPFTPAASRMSDYGFALEGDIPEWSEFDPTGHRPACRSFNAHFALKTHWPQPNAPFRLVKMFNFVCAAQ